MNGIRPPLPHFRRQIAILSTKSIRRCNEILYYEYLIGTSNQVIPTFTTGMKVFDRHV